jgi:hypothetical protein
MTEAEVRCADEAAVRYRLYRVFEFSRQTRVFTLTGPLRDKLRLEPVQYRAGLGPGDEGETGG